MSRRQPPAIGSPGHRPAPDRQDLSDGRRRGARAPRRVADGRARRLRRDHGRLRLRQVDADEHHRLPRRAEPRPVLPRRHRRPHARRGGLSHIRNRKIGFVFQIVQPDPADVRAGERRAAAALRRRPARRERRARASTRSRRSASRTAPALPERDVGRPAAAGRDRPRDRHDPALVLADEPTGNLDTPTSNEIMGIFSRLNAGGRTIVVITHEDDIAVVREARRAPARRAVIEDRRRSPVERARRGSSASPK